MMSNCDASGKTKKHRRKKGDGQQNISGMKDGKEDARVAKLKNRRERQRSRQRENRKSKEGRKEKSQEEKGRKKKEKKN